jgi:hypothetical protein
MAIAMVPANHLAASHRAETIFAVAQFQTSLPRLGRIWTERAVNWTSILPFKKAALICNSSTYRPYHEPHLGGGNVRIQKRSDRMPVVVIAALIVSTLSVSPDTASRCACKPEALWHAGALVETPAVNDTGQAPSAGACETIDPGDSAIASRCGEFTQAATIAESKSEPPAMRSAIALVAIVVVVMLGTIEVLFRCTIYERPSSPDGRQTRKKGVKKRRSLIGADKADKNAI